MTPATPEGTGAPASRGWLLLLAALVVVQAAAVAGWPRVVTIDGPAHLAGAAALLEAGQASHALYRVDLSPVPNLLSAVVLAGLLTVMGPDGAERLLVLAYAVGLPLAAAYALRGVDRRAGWQAVAAVPFVGGYLFAYGFYNLCLGLVGMLLALGIALRHRAGWTPRATVALALVLLLTWTAHLLPLLVAGLVVSLMAVCRAVADRGRGWRTAAGEQGLPVVLAGLPVLALTVAFLGSSDDRGEGVRESSAGALLLGLVGLGRPLVSWTTWEYAGSTLVAVGLAGLAVVRLRRGDRPSADRTALALAAVLMTGWYLASPDRYGPAYGFLNDRLSLFPPLLLLLWSAGPPPSARAGRAAVAAVVVGALALVGARLPTEVRYQRDVAELVSVAPHVPRGSTLVQLRLWRDPPVGPDARNRARDPLRHEAGRVAVLRDAVDVGHYQAVTEYFPVQWRTGTDPRRAVDPGLRGLAAVPARALIADAGPQVVLLVGRERAAPEVLDRPATRRLLGDLERSYRRVAVSAESGLVEVWLRR